MNRIKLVAIIFLALVITKIFIDWRVASNKCSAGDYHMIPITVDNWTMHANLPKDQRPPVPLLDKYRKADQKGQTLEPTYCW